MNFSLNKTSQKEENDLNKIEKERIRKFIIESATIVHSDKENILDYIVHLTMNESFYNYGSTQFFGNINNQILMTSDINKMTNDISLSLKTYLDRVNIHKNLKIICDKIDISVPREVGELEEKFQKIKSIVDKILNCGICHKIARLIVDCKNDNIDVKDIEYVLLKTLRYEFLY